MRGLRLAVAVAALLAMAPAAAEARLIQAETVLPPGQSGYVSIGGLASGTGSPHLSDQVGLFTRFQYKSALFNQPGTTTRPRAGVRLVRDRYGVPSITAGSDYDAWWGVGYAVAEDRLFQLELFKRATAGRLAEILGPDYLDDDLIARRDYYTDGEVDAMVARIPRADLRRRVEAYRDGINAYIAHVRSNPGKMPGEFAALGVPLENWTVRDSARVGIFLARTVPSGDGVEVENARALKAVGPRVFSSLLPLRNKGRVATVPRRNGSFPSQPGRTRRQEIASFKRSRGFVANLALPPEPAEQSGAAAAASASRFLPKGGSYMWAISRRKAARKARKGRRPRKGRRGRKRRPARKAKAGPAYLFNGPQLGYSIPELFVEFELHSPGQDIRGVSAAGVPLVGIGHNGRVAWGFTSGLSDEDDLYAESLTGNETYRYKGGVRRMQCRNERFEYRTPPTDLPDRITDILGNPGQASGAKTERICRTVHGPVQVRAGGGVAYARRYAIWGRELETIVGLSALNDAKSIRDVNRAMLQVTWNENVIAADDRGNIGYWHPGLHPLRPRNYDERLPYPGTGEAEWRGLLPRSRTPHVINPRQGYLFNWNNMPSAGWTNGDSEARERLAGPYHRSAYLRRLVARVKRRPSYARSRAINRSSGSFAQQRPIFERKLRRTHRVARGPARRVLQTLVRWKGSYHRTDSRGTVHPGVAIWEEFKRQAEKLAMGRYARDVRHLTGRPGSSHAFDISNGEAYALRTLSRRRLARAAALSGQVLANRFRTADISRWREPRRMYDVTAQGAAATPELPFFDRGTWEQSVGLRP